MHKSPVDWRLGKEETKLSWRRRQLITSVIVVAALCERDLGLAGDGEKSETENSWNQEREETAVYGLPLS